MLTTCLVALAVGLGLVQISSFCTSVYLHRTLAHRGLQIHPVVAFLMRLHLWLATGIVPRKWVAVHRKHHQFPDEEGDPHSPHIEGLWKILFGNALYYQREASKPETVKKYAHDIPNDIFDRLLFNHGLLGPVMAILILGFLLGPVRGPVTYFSQAGTYIFLSAVINSVCHVIGYKNFQNTATNLQWVAFVTAGEGLHNNHHQYPGSAKFSIRSREFDPGWLLIRILKALGLAKPVKVVSGEPAAARA
jgi:stearoyl-CoA desaturase (delta-9 desaturase)